MHFSRGLKNSESTNLAFTFFNSTFFTPFSEIVLKKVKKKFLKTYIQNFKQIDTKSRIKIITSLIFVYLLKLNKF
jgi:hypothetical protein